MLSDAERNQILRQWNATAREYPDNSGFAELFAAQVSRTPAAIAVRCGNETMSYKELNRRADEVARGLVTAFGQLNPQVPFVVRLDGTNDEEGRKILADANLPNVVVEKTMLGAAAKVVELAGGGATAGGNGAAAVAS